MKKRIWMFVIVWTVILGMMGIPSVEAQADGNVIEVNGTQYASVDEAIGSGYMNNSTIKLLQDVTLTTPLHLYGGTTLDLNGHTLTNGYSDNACLLNAENANWPKTSCKLTIQSSSAGGKILTDRGWGRGTLEVSSDANCTIESGVTIEDNVGVSIENSGTFTVKEGATLLNNNQYTSGVVLQNNSGNAILEGGSYTGEKNIKVYDGTLTINGGIYDDIIGVWNNGMLVIGGGTFNKKISLSNGQTLQDCMKEGYTLKALDSSNTIDMDSSTLTVPARAEEATLYFTKQPELNREQASLLEGYAADETATLTVAATSKTDSITYQWHVIKTPAGEAETTEEIADATSASYQIPTGLAVGSYQYYCVAACGSERVTSEKVLFTVTKNNITTTINGTVTKQRYMDQAFSQMQNAINAADEGASVDITMELGENIINEELTCTLDGTGRKVNLSINLNGRTVEYTDGSTISASKVQITAKNVDVAISGGGTLYARLSLQEKSDFTVNDSITFSGWLDMEGGTAKLSTGTWNHAFIQVKDGASCEITGGTYTQQGSIEVEGGGSLKVSGNTNIEEPLYVKHTVTADGVKRAEVALSGGNYQSIEVPESLDSMYLMGKSYQCAIADMLASGYAFYDQNTNEIVTTLSRTSRKLTNVTVTQGTMPSVDPTKAVVKFNITKTDGTAEEKYFLSWEEAMCELRDSGNEAEYKNWKKVEILLLKDADISEDAAQMVSSDVLPAELVLRSAGDAVYTLSGTSDVGMDIALYTNGQKLTVENIKTDGASIKAVKGTVTIGNGAALAANGSWEGGTIDVTGSTLILEDGAGVSSTYTEESTRTAIRMTDAASLRIQKGAQVTGRVYIDSGDAENSVVIEEDAVLPVISTVSSAKASVYCNLDSTTADAWKAITSAKVYFLIECNDVTLESYDNNITKYDGKIYGRFYEPGVEYGYSTKIKVPDTVCSYQPANGDKTLVDADHTFQMPSAKVTLLTHSPDASGICPHCGKTDLVEAYKNGKLQINGLTGRTYDSQPQILTGITLTAADGSTKNLTGPSYKYGKELAQDSTNPANADLTSADYALVYANNINAYDKKQGESGFDAAKAPKVTITGRGKYTGTIEYYFTIGQGELKLSGFTANSYTYNGYPHNALIYGGVYYELDNTDGETYVTQINVAGSDFAAVSTDKTIDNAGYNSVAAPKIEYSTDNGSTWTEISRNNQDTSKANYQVKDAGSYDFQVRAIDGTNAVSEMQSLTATIKPKALTEQYQIVLDSSPITAYYTGKPIIPADKIKITAPYIPDSNGKTPYVLEKDKDFTVSAENNTEVTDNATLTITGTGNYTGTLTDTFSIAYAFELAQTTASKDHWYTTDVPAEFGVDDTAGDAGNQIVYRSVQTAGDTELSGDVNLYTTQEDAIDGTKNTYIFTEEGRKTVTLYGRNIAKGYITEPVEVTVYIDKTAPVWADKDGKTDGYGIFVADAWWNTKPEKVQSGQYYMTADKWELTMQANDQKKGVNEVSGIDKYYYYVDAITDTADSLMTKTREELDALAEAGQFTSVEAGQGMTAEEADSVSVSVPVTNDGSYIVYAYAVDKAGNQSDYICTDVLVKDTAAPKLAMEEGPSKEDGTLQDTNAQIAFTASEEGMYYYILKKEGETAPTETDFVDKTKKETVFGKTVWAAKDGAIRGKMSKGGNVISLEDLTAKTSYQLYVMAADYAGNIDAENIVTASFTTLKTIPYVETAPVISGTYGDAVKDMKIDATGAKVLDAKGSDTLIDGKWSLQTDKADEIPAVGTQEKYMLVFTPEDTNAYEVITCEVTPIVIKKRVTVVIEDNERQYDEEDPEFTWSMAIGDGYENNTLVGSDQASDLGITLSTTAAKTAAVGTYAITGASESTKYDVVFIGNGTDHKSGVLTVKQAANRFTTELSCSNYTYAKDKTPQPKAAAKFGTVAYKYAAADFDGTAYTAPSDESEYTDAIPVNAGTYVVKAYVAETDNYAGLASDPAVFSILQQKITPNSLEESRSYFYTTGSDGETVSIDLAEKFKLPEDRGSSEAVKDVNDEYDLLSDVAVDADFNLTYKVNEVDASKVDKTAIVDVKLMTQNYELIRYQLTIRITDKKLVTLKSGDSVSVAGSNELTYGEKLSKLTLGSVTFVEEGTDTEVKGMLEWSDPDNVPVVGTKEAGWVFKPADSSLYEELRGNAAITVAKATPAVVTVPTIAERVYNPDAALTDSDMTGGSVTGVDGKALDGSWSLVKTDIIPTVNNTGYQAVFTPADTANYNTVTETIMVKVTKAAPVIAEKPEASALTYGQKLSDSILTGGKAAYDGAADSRQIPGTFAWKNVAIRPVAADSKKTEYDVTFTPSDTDNYNTVDTKLTLIVNKAAAPSNIPDDAMAPPHSMETVGDITLPEGWSWQETDKDTVLADDVAVTATAVYTGADKDNYETISVSIKIIRSVCDHTHTEIRDQQDATCMQPGYTGDTYCTDCDKLLENGKELAALGHDYKASVTKQPTTTEEGIRTYTCTRCGHSYTESIAKLTSQTPSPQPTETPSAKPEMPLPQPKGTKLQDDTGAAYKVTSANGKTPAVQYLAPKSGTKGTVTVPAAVTIDGVTYKVTSIADNAFKGNKKIKKIVIGNNITSIGKNAFAGCTGLTSITIGKNVTKIGKNAFTGCKKLKSIIIKTKKLTTKTVKKGAFNGISKKVVVKVPKSRYKTYKKLLPAKGLKKAVKIRK